MTSVTNMRLIVDGTELPRTADAMPAAVAAGEGIQLSFASELSFDHAGPATLEWQMIRPALSRLPLPAIDAVVELRADIHDASVREDRLLFRGRIDGITEHPRERYSSDLDGIQRITLTATDAIGQLQRTRIGQPPWPAESPQARATRIYNLFPDLLTPPSTWTGSPGGEVAPIDVDNRAPWEILTRSFPRPWGILATGDDGRVHSWSNQYTSHGGTLTRSGDDPWYLTGARPSPLSAHAITEIDRAESYATGISTVSISQVYTAAGHDPTERSVTYGNRHSAGQAVTIDTDLLATVTGDPSTVTVTPRSLLIDTAQEMLATAATAPASLDTLTAPLSQIDAYGVTELLQSGLQRWGTIVSLDTPMYGIPMGHLITGATFTLDVRPDRQTVELSVVPAQLGLYRSITFDGMSRHPEVVFADMRTTWFSDFPFIETVRTF